MLKGDPMIEMARMGPPSTHVKNEYEYVPSPLEDNLLERKEGV